MSTFAPKIFSGLQAFTPFAASMYLARQRSVPQLVVEMQAIAQVIPHAADPTLRAHFAAAHDTFLTLVEQHHEQRSGATYKHVTSTILPLLEQVPEAEWQAMRQAFFDHQRDAAAFHPLRAPRLIRMQGAMQQTAFASEEGPRVILQSREKQSRGKTLHRKQGLLEMQKERIPLHEKAKAICSDLLQLFQMFQHAGYGDIVPGFTDAALLASPEIEVTLREIHPEDETELCVRWRQRSRGIELKLDAKRTALLTSTSNTNAQRLLYAICRSCPTSSAVFLPSASHSAASLLQRDPDYERLVRKPDAFLFHNLPALPGILREQGREMQAVLERSPLPSTLKKEVLDTLAHVEVFPIALFFVKPALTVPSVSMRFRPGRRDVPIGDLRTRDTLILKFFLNDTSEHQFQPEPLFVAASIFSVASWIEQGKPALIAPTPLWTRPGTPFWSVGRMETFEPEDVKEKRTRRKPKPKAPVKLPVKSQIFGEDKLPSLAWIRALQEKMNTKLDPGEYGERHKKLDRRYPGMAELVSLQPEFMRKMIFAAVSQKLKDIVFQEVTDPRLQIPTIAIDQQTVSDPVWKISVAGAAYMTQFLDSMDFFETAFQRVHFLWETEHFREAHVPHQPLFFAPYTRRISRDDTVLVWTWIRLYHAYEALKATPHESRTLQIKIAKQRGTPPARWLPSFRTAMSSLKKSELQQAPFTWLLESAPLTHVAIDREGDIRSTALKEARRVFALVAQHARLICFDGNPLFPQDAWNQLVKTIAQLPQGFSEIEAIPTFRVIGTTVPAAPPDDYDANPQYRLAPAFLQQDYRRAMTSINLEARGAGLKALTPQSTPEALKKLYRSLATRLHPDQLPEGGNERFRALQEAYEVIRSFHPK